MKTLILVPTELELRYLNPRYDLSQRLVGPWSVCQDAALDWALCGIGPAAASVTTSHLIRHLRPDRVVLAGIAGAFARAGLALGDIYAVTRETLADTGYADDDRFYNLDAMNLPMLPREDRQFGCDFELADLPGDLPTTRAITVAAVTNSTRRADTLWRTFGAGLENMEGAAVALACALDWVPFSELRAVSNRVGPRDPRSWQVREPLERLGTWIHENLVP